MTNVRAQPGAIDISFNPGSGADSQVYAIATTPDNKIVIGGGFTSVNGVSRNRIARLLADGTLDSGFFVGAGLNSFLFSICVEPDGKALIGGGFTSVNGVARAHLTRLRSDGSLDLDFPNISVNNAVRQILRQADGRIIILGDFTTVNSIPRGYVARLNADYSLDSNFNPAAGITNGIIQALAMQPDGKVVLGGTFTTINGLSRYYIVRVYTNGVVDTNFNAGFIGNSGAASVTRLALQSDEKIVLSGFFDNINGYSRKKIARLNQDGSVDTDFAPPSGIGSPADTISLQTDNKILISGGYNVAAGPIARLNSNGTKDSSFEPTVGSGYPYIYAHLLQPDGRVLIVGDFSRVSNTNVNNIARLLNDGIMPPGGSSLGVLLYPGMLVSGTVSNNYRVEYTTNLATQSLWTSLTTFTLQNNPQLIVDPAPASASLKRFYRAVNLP